MSGRDWYAGWLLGEVWRLCPNGIDVWREDGQWRAAGGGHETHADTEADALAALYRDLTDTEPPPRPTEEEVRAWAGERIVFTTQGTDLWVPLRAREAAASDEIRDRLMARAVVEMPMGGGS